MRTGVVVGIAAPIVLIVGAGGYAWADLDDRVPGILTTQPVPASPAPFLVAAEVQPGDGPAGPAQGVTADAPLPDAATVQAMAQALRDDARTGSSTNIAVVDLATGTYLADVSASEPQVPASTTKVLTTVAAIHVLGPDFTTHTDAVYDAARGELALVAGGDMLLAAGAGHGGDLPTANGWAGLDDLAQQAAVALAAQGVTSVRVVYDDSAFPGPAIPAEWPAYVVPSGFGAPVTGLAVDIGRKTEEHYAPRWSNPSANAADVFAAALATHGVAVTTGGARDGAVGDVVGSVTSAPLWRVVEHTLHESDNTIAEIMSRVLARETGQPVTPAGASAAITAALVEMGVDTTGLELYDGAGFSNRNRISPAHLVDAMRVSVTDPNARDFLEWLPVGALEGTVGERYADTAAAGLSRAKTGSLTGVTSLAGIVQTADGRVLLFAVLADGMPAGQDRPRTAIDEFVVALAQCGCGGSPP